MPVSDDRDSMSISAPLDVNLSDEQDIFLTHCEGDEVKLKSFDEHLIKFSPTSTVSSKMENDWSKGIEDEIKELDYNRSETMECMAVVPESPE